jgi:hypothetical protein
MGSMVLLSAHHFLIYARQVADELERDCVALGEEFRRSTPSGEAVCSGP